MTYPHARLAVMNPPTAPSPVFESYWRFAAERHRIYEQRLRGLPAPWTADPVLSAYRFTNVFRAADRVSQFLIRDVIYRGDQTVDEIVFRVLTSERPIVCSAMPAVADIVSIQTHISSRQ